MAGSVGRKRLLEIMGANFLAAAFVASPIGIFMWYVNPTGMFIRDFLIFFIGWPVSWGLFSMGRAWQKNREDVAYPAPMKGILDRLGLNGETEYFVDLLYFPGAHIPDYNSTASTVPKFLR